MSAHLANPPPWKLLNKRNISEENITEEEGRAKDNESPRQQDYQMQLEQNKGMQRKY